MKSFAGRVAAITGAASGMGRSLAVALAKRGCEVAISDIDPVGLAETARLARAVAPAVRVTTRRLDVGDEAAVRSWAENVASEHGRCNYIFNNAGIAYGATLEGGDPAEVERIMRVNFWGVVHGTRAFLPYLRASGDGHVVNTSSVFGLIAFPGSGAYNASKFAVRGYTEALAIEMKMSGAPVAVTCVHPGGIKTNIAKASKMHPSIADLGVEVEGARERFERGFRVTADEAAEIILRGVQKNARRVLVGSDAYLIDVMQRLLPGHYHELIIQSSRRILKMWNGSAKAAPAKAPPPAPPRRVSASN